MQYLGGISGTGTVKFGSETLSRAQYDIDRYMLKPGQLVGSGELRMPSESLKKLFGRTDLHLVTHDGQHLRFRFSDKRLADASQTTHIDVTGTDNIQ